MSNYELTSGFFAGSIVGDEEILDLDFFYLDEDLQIVIRDWAENQVGQLYSLVNGGYDFAYRGVFGRALSMNEIKRDYEKSWLKTETNQERDLFPCSAALEPGEAF